MGLPHLFQSVKNDKMTNGIIFCQKVMCFGEIRNEKLNNMSEKSGGVWPTEFLPPLFSIVLSCFGEIRNDLSPRPIFQIRSTEKCVRQNI